MNTKKEVKLRIIAERMNLKYLTPEVSTKGRGVTIPDINRPSLQLAGYFEKFPYERVQIVGYIEYRYVHQLSKEERIRNFTEYLSYDLPCVIFCRGLEPSEEFLKLAVEKDVPVYITDVTTSVFMAELIRWLNEELAPCISIHGVLIDVYGVGVLIQGESGIGKSEAALELVKRGHRLVSDDVVEIRKINDTTLLGSAPEVTKHFIELRGIGIVDVKTLYGVQSVRETQTIDMIITLEEWDKQREYDRLGMDDAYTEILENKIICHNIPIRPGRNVALIVETAAINHRQKEMGYNAAHELYRRVQKSMEQRRDD